MKISKRISWHAAAIAAALVVSGAANADGRGGHRDHGRRDGYSHRGNDHQRAWRDYRGHSYRYYDRGRHDRHNRHRHYYYQPRSYYYGHDSYYAPSWSDYGYGGYGASLTFQFPLR